MRTKATVGDPSLGDVDEPPIPAGSRRVAASARAQRRRMDRLITDNRPAVMKGLARMWNAQIAKTDHRFIERGIINGTIAEDLVSRWGENYVAGANQFVIPQLKAVSRGGAEALRKGLVRSGVDASWDLLGDHVDEWASRKGAQWVADVTATQRKAINGVLELHTIRESVSTRTLAQMLRPVIGLTRSEARSVLNSWFTAIGFERQDPRDIAIITRRAQRVRKVRADRIARTELAFAYNRGAQIAVKEAKDQGEFGDRAIIKRWYTQVDERVCDHCGPLHNVAVDIEGTYPGVTARELEAQTPPAHPNCRCVLLYEIVEPET